MDYREFVRQVQEEAGISLEQAENAVRATLETLGERLGKRRRERLQAQLPGDLRPLLSQRPEGDAFGSEEFLNRVSARAEVGFPEAQREARATLRVLARAVSPGELAEALRGLGDFGNLMQAQGPSSLTH